MTGPTIDVSILVRVGWRDSRLPWHFDYADVGILGEILYRTALAPHPLICPVCGGGVDTTAPRPSVATENGPEGYEAATPGVCVAWHPVLRRRGDPDRITPLWAGECGRAPLALVLRALASQRIAPRDSHEETARVLLDLVAQSGAALPQIVRVLELTRLRPVAPPSPAAPAAADSPNTGPTR